MKNKFLLLGLLLFVLACAKKEDDQPIPKTPDVDPNPIIDDPTPIIDDGTISLANLKAGQKSTFRHYTSICDNADADFEYTGDKLEVEVIDIDGALYLQETYTEDSPSSTLEPATHLISGNEKMVLIPERQKSYIFFFYGNDTIHLEANNRIVMEQSGCRIMQAGNPFIGNDIGSVAHFQLGQVEQFDKTVVSCVPTILDMEAYLLYDKNKLHVSQTIQGSEFGGIVTEFISGWELIKE